MSNNDSIKHFSQWSGATIPDLEEVEKKETSPAQEKIILDLKTDSPEEESLIRKHSVSKTDNPFYKNGWVRVAGFSVVSLAALGVLNLVLNGTFGVQSAKVKKEMPNDLEKNTTDGDIAENLACESIDCKGQSTPLPLSFPQQKQESSQPKPVSPKPSNVVKPQVIARPQTATITPIPRRIASSIPADYNPPRLYRRPPAPIIPSPVFQPKPSKSLHLSPSPSPVLQQKEKKSARERMLAALEATSYGGTGQAGSASAQPQPGQTSANSQNVAFLSSEQAAIDGIPQQLLSRSQKTTGKLSLGIAFTPDYPELIEGQQAEVVVTGNTIEGLPPGSAIIARIELPKTQRAGGVKNAALRLIPIAIAKGDVEMPIDEGSIILSGKNGKPLIAKRGGSEFLRSIGNIAKTALGSLGGLASNLLPTGNGVNVISGIPQQLLTQGQSAGTVEVLMLKADTDIQISIMKPLSIPLAEASQTAASFHPSENAMLAQSGAGMVNFVQQK
jgi:hypothetical protein